MVATLTRGAPPRGDGGGPSGGAPRPSLAPKVRTARALLAMLSGLLVCFLAQLAVLSPLEQRAAQQRAYDKFRADLANGVAPVSAAEYGGREGTPIAYLEIPAIGLRQVVLEGTSGSVLTSGPGHRRDTVLPGYAGTSVVMGRRSTYGSPFRRIDDLKKGTEITVTTGAGVATYEVIGPRREGDTVPAPVESGGGRLILATATGNPIAPSGVVLVDADLVGEPLGAARPAVAAGGLPSSERPMGTDTSTVWRLLLWLQAMLVVTLGSVWAWHRWDPVKAWISCLPPFVLVGILTSQELSHLLPNLL